MDQESLSGPDFERFVELMYGKLPPELIDQIEEFVYEMVFCPGYISEDRSYKGSKNARPELLLLSKGIFQKYHKRTCTENTWVIKTEAGKYYELKHLPNHLLVPYGKICPVDEGLYLWLRSDLKSTGQHWWHSDYMSLEELLELRWELDDCHRKLLDFFNLPHYEHNHIKAHCLRLTFMDCYGPSGEWLGWELQPDSPRPQSRGYCAVRQPKRSTKLLLEGIAHLTKRRREYREELVPEMANMCRKVSVHVRVVNNTILVLT